MVTSTPSDGPSPRYPTASRRTAPVIAAVAAIGVVATAWLGVQVWQRADPDVAFKDVGFRVISDTQIEARYRLTRDPGVPASCYLQALNVDVAVVGDATIRVPASSARTTEHTTVVSTQERAVTVVVKHCERDRDATSPTE